MVEENARCSFSLTFLCDTYSWLHREGAAHKYLCPQKHGTE